MLKIAFNRKYF